MFDSFWNSEGVVSAQNLDIEPDPEFVKETWANIQKANREAPALQGFPLEVKDWTEELAEDLAHIMERDMGPDNAWQVLMDDEGELYWINSDTRVEEQPARDGTQRVLNEIFKIFPKEQY
jgi:hypothetical protein